MTSGERIGPYLIEGPLGEGGMGEVWKARDTRLDRTVAIKISKAEFGERFAREAHAVAALNHPNICTLYDVGPNYLVMEHIEGTPLKGPLPVQKAVEYASQILDALDAAHRKGIVHRDLKPANILVTKQGIKLLDFGLAKQAAGPLKQTDATLTGEGQIVGTLQYLSPEQLQGKPTDARSDLFAFGCVLYEMLSGKRAFVGTSPASVIAAILEHEPAPLDLHPPLGRVIAKCLAKDPDERFQTARDLKTALIWAMEQQQPAFAIGRLRWPWAVAAASLAIGALGTWAFTRSRATAVEGQAVRLQLAPPEGGRFDLSSLAVSPDGRMLAYVAAVQGKRGLWVRPLNGHAAKALPGTDNALYPFWSPDASSIGYFANSKLWRIGVAGGAPLAICDVTVATGGAWGDDGRIVFGSITGPLIRVSASGGSPAPLTALKSSREESWHRWPQLLPGGRAVLFQVLAAKVEDTGVYGAFLDRPLEPVRVVAADRNAIYSSGHLLWRRGSTLVAQPFDPDRLRLSGEPAAVTEPVGDGIFTKMALAGSASGVLLYGASSGNIHQLTWFDRGGKPSGTLGLPGAYSAFALSPDGRRVAVPKTEGSGSDLWTLDAKLDAWSRLTFAAGVNSFPVWSPDGRTIVFYSSSPPSLSRKDSSGAGAEERVAQSGNALVPTDWSRDGRSLLYYENAPGTNRDLWVLPVTPEGRPQAGARPRPYLRTPKDERFGRFSPEPNPRWVAYDSDFSGRREVYVQAYPEPRGEFLVSSGGGQFPAWGPDGREIFYVSADSKLMSVKLKVGPDFVQPSPPSVLFDVTVDGVAPVASPYAVAPDGKRFLVRAPVIQGAQPLEVIVNWPALLKKAPGAE